MTVASRAPVTPRPVTVGEVLRRAVLGQARFAVPATLLIMAHQALESLVPVAIGMVVDQAVSTGARQVLLGWLVALAVLFLCLSLAFRFGARLGTRAVQQGAHELRLWLVDRILDPRGGAERSRLPGALLSTATVDALRVGELVRVLAFLGGAVTALVVTAVALLRISVPLGLVVLLGAPPLLAVVHLLGKPLARRTAVEQAAAAHASGLATDLVAGLRILKGIGAERAAGARYEQASGTARATAIRSGRAQALYEGATILLTALFIAIVALVGGRLALAGRISVGDLVAAVGLAQFLLGPMSRLAFVGAGYARASASAARIADVLATPYAVPDAPRDTLPAVRGELRITALHHGTLRGVDLDVTAGELVGVLAADPADASALLAVLARDADPGEGQVELDGRALAALHPVDVHAAVLVARHDADLFEGTVRDNVAAAAVDDEWLDRAVEAADVAHVTATLPDGADTWLTEHARELSGGGRQRVALARALAADPPVLVLHDPTTAVDVVTEARVAAGVRGLRAGRTTLLVASSPTLLAVTDRVVVLDGGRVVATGTHPELLAGDERYRELVLR